MGIGLGIVLLVIGLILALDAVSLPNSIQNHIDQDTLGWILVAVGALAIVLALVIWAPRNRGARVVEERRIDPPV